MNPNTSTPTPGLPPPQGAVEDIFTLYYRSGSNPHTMQKQFRYKGNLRGAIERGRKHCDIVGIKFVRVQQFLSNIEIEERNFMNGGQDEHIQE